MGAMWVRRSTSLAQSIRVNPLQAHIWPPANATSCRRRDMIRDDPFPRIERSFYFPFAFFPFPIPLREETP